MIFQIYKTLKMLKYGQNNDTCWSKSWGNCEAPGGEKVEGFYLRCI